jgi:lactoylglutathione lyase
MFNADELNASLTVADVQKSMAWYRDVIGFEIQQERERDGKLSAVSLKAGNVRIIINQDDGQKGWDRKKGEGISLQFTTSDNIDELATRIKASGQTLEYEPTDMPWGVRMFRLRDPDGFRIAFSSPRK